MMSVVLGQHQLHRQAAKALLRPRNESGLGRADRPAQLATDSVPAGRANRQAGADTQCRRLSFVGWSLRICFSFKAGQWVAPPGVVSPKNWRAGALTRSAPCLIRAVE